MARYWRESVGALPEGVTHSSRGTTSFSRSKTSSARTGSVRHRYTTGSTMPGSIDQTSLGILQAANSDWASCEDLVETTLRKAPGKLRGTRLIVLDFARWRADVTGDSAAIGH